MPKHPKRYSPLPPPAAPHLAVVPSIPGVDKEAFTRAIEWVRAHGEPIEVKALDVILSRDGFEAAGRSAAHTAQCRSLGLRPWQCPPSDAVGTEPADCYGWRPAEIGLRDKLLAAGLSRFEPSPVEALHAAGRRAT
jgi:hypothetical protein